MVTRRAILFSGLSLPLLASAGIVEREILALTSGGKVMASRSAQPFVSHALFATQAPEAERFAQVFNDSAASVYGLQGDIADFWYVKTRYGAEKKRPVHLKSIVGMTLPAAAFCLGIAGRDLRMTIALRVDHRQGSRRSIHHTVFGPEALVAAIATGLIDPSRDWPEVVGTVIRGLSACDLAGHAITHELLSPASMSASIEHLTTWVLAPVRSELPSAAS